jgi:hypothetical protein
MISTPTTAPYGSTITKQRRRWRRFWRRARRQKPDCSQATYRGVEGRAHFPSPQPTMQTTTRTKTLQDFCQGWKEFLKPPKLTPLQKIAMVVIGLLFGFSILIPIGLFTTFCESLSPACTIICLLLSQIEVKPTVLLATLNAMVAAPSMFRINDICSGFLLFVALACSLWLSLPTTTFLHFEYSTECAICLEYIRPYQTRDVLTCKHSYHHSCLDQWRRHNASCPICRSGFSCKGTHG